MFKKTVFLSIAAFAVLGTANAVPKTSFCEGNACTQVKIKSSATVVVKSVTVIQQTKNGKCTKEERKVSENLTAGQSYSIVIREDCNYKFKFKTTSGCTGDKSKTLTPEQQLNNKD